MVSLSGNIGEQVTDNGLDGVLFSRGLLGLRLTPSERTRLTGGLGFQNHEVHYYDSLDQDMRFHFDVRGTWAATDKITFQFFGRNEYQPTSAFRTNTKRVDQGLVGLIYEISRRWYCTAGYSYRADAYTAPVMGVEHPLETHNSPQFRLVFSSRKKHLSLYLKGRYEIFESNIQEDYNQLRLTVGGNFAF